MNRSHAAGDRVVLTVTCFSQQALDAITSDPNAAGRLSAALIAAVQAKNLDGVNFDFEGEGSADQVGLTKLITTVSAALHVANPHWQVTMAVYASAAGDPHGFYNIAALAPALDGFFVMAYDMNSKSQPSATSPLFNGNYSDVQTIESFLKVVPPAKIVLGLPYYGYDWPTTGGTLPATATGSESPLPYSSIKASGHPTYWDPVTDTPWTSYQVGTQWHTTFFDDPTSMALKAQLANYFHIAGVGIWALGMDGNDPAMLAALLGNAPAAKDALTGPPAGTGFVSVATFAGVPNLALDPDRATAGRRRRRSSSASSMASRRRTRRSPASRPIRRSRCGRSPSCPAFTWPAHHAGQLRVGRCSRSPSRRPRPRRRPRRHPGRRRPRPGLHHHDQPATAHHHDDPRHHDHHDDHDHDDHHHHDRPLTRVGRRPGRCPLSGPFGPRLVSPTHPGV